MQIGIKVVTITIYVNIIVLINVNYRQVYRIHKYYVPVMKNYSHYVILFCVDNAILTLAVSIWLMLCRVVYLDIIQFYKSYISGLSSKL